MKPELRSIEIRVEIAAADADQVNDVLLELQDERWSLVEDVLVTKAWLVGIFESVSGANESWKRLSSHVEASVIGNVDQRTLEAGDWQDSYKAHFHAWQFGSLHWVPVWQRDTFRLPPGHAVLWLDPGMAFGTGNHETTRLCVERLVENASRAASPAKVIDAGCGSGILALSAAKLGFLNVVGFDNDPEAVRVSQENAAMNELSRVEFFVADLTTGLPKGSGDIVFANILANVLQQFAQQLADSVAPDGIVILSGILAQECADVRACFSSICPSWPQTSRTLGEWSDVVLRRPSR
jgi:ribosomal protein L11 methyltransferase